MDWITTKKQLPATEAGAQIQVLMFIHGWACPIYGMYTHWSDGGKWSIYDQLNDRYVDFDVVVPESWVEVTRPAE